MDLVAEEIAVHMESIDDDPTLVSQAGSPRMASVLQERLEPSSPATEKKRSQGRSRLANASFASSAQTGAPAVPN